MSHIGLHVVELEHEEWGSSRKSKRVLTPALTANVTNREIFAKLWFEACKLRATCGCSVFISDGQEIDVRVMPTEQVTYAARGMSVYSDILQEFNP